MTRTDDVAMDLIVEGYTVRERWQRTAEFCPRCGMRGTWKHATDHTARICLDCESVFSLPTPPRRTSPRETFGRIIATLRRSS
jgi:hypothetical protein